MITEAWLYDQECCEEVERYMNSVFKYLRDNRKSLSQEKLFFFERERPHTDYFQIQAPVVLVLELRLSGSCGYYFVDHKTKRLF